MAVWIHRVKIKHLLTDDEDHATTQATMNDIANILDAEMCFAGFDTARFRAIPEGDEFFGPADYANKLLAEMCDFADAHRIWIE